MTAQERFVSKSKPAKGGCIEFTGFVKPDGYGWFWYNGTQCYAHRMAWQLTYGVIPKGLCVLHHCDNRKCVNARHLFLGTQVDNLEDCRKKGRARTHHVALSKEEIEQVRELKDQRVPYQVIQKQFDIGRTTVYRIWKRKDGFRC